MEEERVQEAMAEAMEHVDQAQLIEEIRELRNALDSTYLEPEKREALGNTLEDRLAMLHAEDDLRGQVKNPMISDEERRANKINAMINRAIEANIIPRDSRIAATIQDCILRGMDAAQINKVIKKEYGVHLKSNPTSKYARHTGGRQAARTRRRMGLPPIEENNVGEQ